MRRALVMVLIVLSALATARVGVAGETEVHNRSGLVVRKNPAPEPGAGYRPTHVCSGVVDAGVDLDSVHLSPRLLEDGVECVAGDFDGNGSLDFALFQPPDRPNELIYQIALVIFFEGSRVKEVSELPDPPQQLCPAGHGCLCLPDVNTHDGLEQMGGGDYDRSALYVVATGEWQRFQCGGDDDSGG